MHRYAVPFVSSPLGLLLVLGMLSNVPDALAQPASGVQTQPVPNPAQDVTSSPERAPSYDAAGGYRAPTDSGDSGSGLPSPHRAAPLPPPAPAPQDALVPNEETGVRYLCGGSGQEEAEQMRQRAQEYGLMLTFAARTGNYLANVHVDIVDAKGSTVLSTTCDAPMMLVNLPRAGTYRVRAETGGYTLSRTARVNSAGRAGAIVMAWPAEAAGVETNSMSGGNAASGQSGSP